MRLQLVCGQEPFEGFATRGLPIADLYAFYSIFLNFLRYRSLNLPVYPGLHMEALRGMVAWGVDLHDLLLRIKEQLAQSRAEQVSCSPGIRTSFIHKLLDAC